MKLGALYLTLLTCSLVLTTSLLQGCVGVFAAGAAGGAASLVSDPRTAGTMIEDNAIEFRLASQIQNDKELADRSNVNVTSYNGILLLTGETPTEDLRKRITQYAKNDSKIREVHDELTIQESLPLRARNYDSWLTTKVKTKLLNQKELNAVAIKVVTSGQNVYLMGLVKHSEAQLAAQDAAEVEGVNRVIKTFEYTD